MKKTLCFMMVGAFLFASCKKTEPTEPKDEKLYEVKFKVGLFSQTVSDFPVASKKSSGKYTTSDDTPPNLSKSIARLDYFLYNSEGTRIANRTIQSDSSAIGFELPTANLKAGKYRVVFMGARGKGGGWPGYYYYSHHKFTPSINRGDWNNGSISDLFFSSVEFQVGGEDSYVDVNLKRMGGQLRIVVEDEWPSNIERIGLSLNVSYSYQLAEDRINQSQSDDMSVPKNYKTTYEMVNGFPVPKQVFVDCSWENFIFAAGSQATTLNGTLTAYSKYNDVVVTKNLTNIKVEQNKVTTVRGKLFDDLGFNPTSSFNLTIDSAMAGDINQTF